jgi:hypothetical protein
MRKIFLTLVATILLLGENSYLTNISFESDEDGDLASKIYFPIYWKRDIFSSFSYNSFSENESGSISSFSDSRKSISFDQQNFNLNLISVKYVGDDLSYSLGLSTELTKIDKREFGFLKDQNGIFGEKSNWLIFDNFTEIDVLKYGFYLEFMGNPTNWLFLRVSGDISPKAEISLNQSTRFKPLVSETGNYREERDQDLSYSALGEIMIKGSFFSIGAEYQYSFFPLEYNLKSVSENSSDFKLKKIKSETILTSWLIKIVFNYKIFGNMKPSFGYGIRKISEKDVLENSERNSHEKIFRFGFENRF